MGCESQLVISSHFSPIYYDNYFVCIWNSGYNFWMFYEFSCSGSYYTGTVYVNTFDDVAKKCL
jgi:hypothetical protein